MKNIKEFLLLTKNSLFLTLVFMFPLLIAPLAMIIMFFSFQFSGIFLEKSTIYSLTTSLSVNSVGLITISILSRRLNFLNIVNDFSRILFRPKELEDVLEGFKKFKTLLIKISNECEKNDLELKYRQGDLFFNVKKDLITLNFKSENEKIIEYETKKYMEIKETMLDDLMLHYFIKHINKNENKNIILDELESLYLEVC